MSLQIVTILLTSSIALTIIYRVIYLGLFEILMLFLKVFFILKYINICIMFF